MKERLFLTDVLSELLSRARAAAESARTLTDTDAEVQRAFTSGRLQGYYEVLSYLINELDAFGIPRSSVGWPEIMSLERELL